MLNLKALKKSYRKYVKIQNIRIGKTGNRFYAEMAEAIYQATEKALDPSITHMHIVPAQTGSGKSTYMEAMVAALSDNGMSCAIVAKTINQCHKIYMNVTALVGQPTGKALIKKQLKYIKGKGHVPDLKVAIYTSVHKFNFSSDGKKHGVKSKNIDYYTKYDKIRAPIVISTHTALLNELDEDVDLGIQKRDGELRDVVFLDETPDFNLSMSIEKWEIELVQSLLLTSKFKEHKKAISKLLKGIKR